MPKRRVYVYSHIKFLRPFTFKAIFIFLILLRPNDLLAFQDMDKYRGADQSFTTEYNQETFAENFHKQELLAEQPPVDEVEKQPLDLWRYYRTFSSGIFHSSNFSATYRDPKPETIFTYGYTGGMSHRTQYTFIKMFYGLSYADYVQNDKSSRFSNNLATSLQFKFNRLKINITNQFRPDTAFVQGERTDLKTTQGKNVLIYSNAFNVVADYKYSPKTTLSYTYTNSLSYFPRTTDVTTDNSGQSTMTHTFSPKVSYQLTPKTSIFLDHSFIVERYLSGDVYGTHAYNADIGVNSRLFTGIGLSLSVGYFYDQFLKTNNPPVKGLGFSAGISKKISPKVQGTLTASHQITRDYDSSLFKSSSLYKDSYSLNLTWKALRHVTVEAEGTAVYTARDGYITMPDLDNPANLYTRPREDQLYKFGLRLNWLPKDFFNFVLAYEFTNQNASFKNFEYYSQEITGYFDYAF